MYDGYKTAEIETAVSAVLSALIRTLVDKDVLSNSDVRQMLTRAVSALGPHDYGAPVHGAAGLILAEIMPQFPDAGGD